MLFPDAGSSALKAGRSILLIRKYLGLPMFFAYSALLICKLFIMNKLLAEAAGVELVLSIENT
jgi:hypothetical protein